MAGEGGRRRRDLQRSCAVAITDLSSPSLTTLKIKTGKEALVHAYVINLARSPERRAHITAELDQHGIDYELVTGVDGRDLDVHDSAIVDPSVLDASWFRPGVAGCAVSHLRVYQEILAAGVDRALVLEDDIIVPADLSRLADMVAGELTGAEVVLLNYDSKVTCKMSREGVTHLPSSRMLVLPIDVSQPESAAAYVITREACERMIKKILPFQARADDWGHFYTEGALDRVRCVMPLTVSKSHLRWITIRQAVSRHACSELSIATTSGSSRRRLPTGGSESGRNSARQNSWTSRSWPGRRGWSRARSGYLKTLPASCP
jgi:glycosyl transferase family 25